MAGYGRRPCNYSGHQAGPFWYNIISFEFIQFCFERGVGAGGVGGWGGVGVHSDMTLH